MDTINKKRLIMNYLPDGTHIVYPSYLLISNSTMNTEADLEWCIDNPDIKDFLITKCKGKEILFIPYAKVCTKKEEEICYNEYEKEVAKVFNNMIKDVKLVSIHHYNDPIKAVQEARCIVVGDGNVFLLAKKLHRLGLMKVIQNRAQRCIPYIGWGAGSTIAGPTLCTTQDMPIVKIRKYQCLNLVPFHIYPHYTEYSNLQFGGKSIDDRLFDYITMHPNERVVAMRENTALEFNDKKLYLDGIHHSRDNSKSHNNEDENNAPYGDYDMKVLEIDNAKKKTTLCNVNNNITILMKKK